MASGIDCATPLTAQTAAAFKRDGMEFACRYLVPNGWKALTRQEAENISAAGLKIVSVFETTADRALGGRAAGLADAATALQVAAQVGQPEGSCIYAAVDVDIVTSSQMAAVIEYIRAFSEATPTYTTGVYGEHDVINAVIESGACSRGWQTYGWSGGKKSWRAQIYQYQNGVDRNGIQVDLNESYGSEGWWSLAVEPPKPALAQEDANKVIALLGSLHEFVAGQEAKDEIHRLANTLRKASGQAEE